MRKRSFIKFLITLLCAVLFVCAGFAVSNFFNREDSVTVHAATVTPTIYWGVYRNNTLQIGSTTSAQTGCSLKGSFAGTASQNWQSQITDKTQITKIDVRDEISPVNMTSWFGGFTSLSDISTLNNIDTSNCTRFDNMFSGCGAITSLEPLSDWNVSSLSSAISVFRDCSGIQSIDPLKNWEFKSLDSIESVFYGCTGITSVETIYGWDLTNCYDISGLFSGMKSIKSIDCTRLQIDKSKLSYVLGMFDSCSALENVNVSGLISPDMPATNIVSMFYNCQSLKMIEGLDTWDTSNINNFGAIVNSSPLLSSIDMSGWSFDNATNIQSMFAGCSGLEVIKFNDTFINAINRISQNLYIPFPLHDAEGNIYNSVSDLTAGGTYYTSVAHTHVFSTAGVVTPPTCNAQGYTTKHCDVCDMDVQVDFVDVDPTAHVWSTWTTKTAANCTDDEVQKRTCSVCSAEETQTLTGTATGHAKGAHHGAVAATCSKTGNVEYWECGNGCGKFVNDSLAEIADVTIPVNPSAHEWGEYASDDNATCETDGTKTAYCIHCNTPNVVTETGTAKGHKWVTTWSKDDTNHWHVCENGCGIKGGETTHAYSWVTDIPATITTTGIKHEECVCGAKRSENTVIPVQTCAHANLTHYPRVEATCVAAGNVEYWHCADCNKNLDSVNTELPDVSIPVDNTAHVFTVYVSNGDATYTADGTKTAQCDRGCGATDTVPDAGSMLTKAPANITGLTLADAVYGEALAPYATTDYGIIEYTYSTAEDGTYSTTLPVDVGTYWVKASVADGESWLAAEVIVSFKITPRAITITINPASSEKGAELEALTATLSAGTVAAGDNVNDLYVLSTDADKSVLGTYTITGVCTNNNYDITFIDGVYIVSQRADDENGGGEIDIPKDIDVEFKVTQSSTNNDYSELSGMKAGYWAQLWYRNEDGTLGEEFMDKMNCILTLKIPVKIIEGIRGGEEINREKIAEGLAVYYVDEGGKLVAVENFKIAQKEDESWIVKFNYNATFRAEIVFNASNVEEKGETPAAGTSWWVWLIVGLGSAAVVGVVVVIIVVAKMKNGGNGGAPATVIQQGTAYDDAELKARLSDQDRKLDEIKEIVDGGFNDKYDGDDV